MVTRTFVRVTGSYKLGIQNMRFRLTVSTMATARKFAFFSNRFNVISVHHFSLDECVVRAMRKQNKLISDGAESGS